MTDPVLYALDGDVAVVTLNRPEVLNTVDAALLDAFIAAMQRANGDPAARAVVITGAGERAFSAGQDLAVAATFTAETIGPWFRRLGALYQSVRALDKPSVMALNGAAVGFGFQVALHADYRIAHPGVRMSQPEVKAGIPSALGLWVMRQALSHNRMVDMALSGRMVDAETCLAWGLVNRIVPREQVMPESLALARELAALPPGAFKLTKQRLRELTQPGYDDAIEAAVRIQTEAFATGEPQAVARAFLEQRAGQRR